MLSDDLTLAEGQKLYFASDFHLGVPTLAESHARERLIIRWLEMARKDARMIFLVGDIFDFWFEYKRAVPKGFVRLQGTLAQMADEGVPMVLFTGNHDMWMKDYFPTEFGIPVYHDPIDFTVNGVPFHLGHGDGLGPGDHKYKLIKKVFRNSFFQWCFARLHPNFGIGIADRWSRKSRATHGAEVFEFKGEDEWLWQYCKAEEQKRHRAYYVFGHRHLPLDLGVGPNSRYINLGEWVHHQTYAVYDGQGVHLLKYSLDGTSKPAL